MCKEGLCQGELEGVGGAYLSGSQLEGEATSPAQEKGTPLQTSPGWPSHPVPVASLSAPTSL